MIITLIFRNFAIKMANLLRLGKKKTIYFLFCTQLFVTLQRILCNITDIIH